MSKNNGFLLFDKVNDENLSSKFGQKFLDHAKDIKNRRIKYYIRKNNKNRKRVIYRKYIWAQNYIEWVK